MLSNNTSIYDFKVKTLRGKDFDFSDLKGKVVLIFNSASACGFTPQLKGLQSLYEQYQDKGLVVVGFPTDDFKQETGTEGEIEEFCQLNYGVKFPMMEKIHVNGSQTHPLYAYLKKQKKSLMMEMIKWNFEKFLIDRDGKVISRYASTTTPESIKADIEKLL